MSEGPAQNNHDRRRNRLDPTQRFILAFVGLLIVLLVVIWVTSL
jgi:hypothetical protein